MEPRIQYAQTKDGVSIAHRTLGHGSPLVYMPPIRIDAEGNVVLSNKPSLGIELDEPKCRRYEV